MFTSRRNYPQLHTNLRITRRNIWQTMQIISSVCRIPNTITAPECSAAPKGLCGAKYEFSAKKKIQFWLLWIVGLLEHLLAKCWAAVNMKRNFFSWAGSSSLPTQTAMNTLSKVSLHRRKATEWDMNAHIIKLFLHVLCTDTFSRGHQNTNEKARKKGIFLSVAMLCDEHYKTEAGWSTLSNAALCQLVLH